MPRFKNESCDHMDFYGLSREADSLIWNVVDGVLFVPTVIGNSLILLSIVRHRHLRTKIHILIGHLAANDLLVGLTLLPLDTIGNSTDVFKDKYFCLTKLSVFALTLGGSCLGLLMISIERFSAVAFPLHHAYFTKKKLFFAMACGWAYVAFFTLAPLAGCNTVAEDVMKVECNASIVWGGWCKLAMNINFIASLTLNIILYVIVVRIAVKRVKEHGRQTGTSTSILRSREMSKTVTVAAALGLFALLWTPYACMTFVITIHHRCISKHYSIRRWGLLLGLCNCCVNWLIFGLRNRDFRQAFKIYVPCRKERRQVACSMIQLQIQRMPPGS